MVSVRLTGVLQAAQHRVLAEVVEEKTHNQRIRRIEDWERGRSEEGEDVYVVSPEELEAEFKVPVINTKLVGIRHAETLVVGKTSHSLSSYPWAGGLKPESVTRREN
jgi:hypothetical protein